jgi:hypothetical protein
LHLGVADALWILLQRFAVGMQSGKNEEPDNSQSLGQARARRFSLGMQTLTV